MIDLQHLETIVREAGAIAMRQWPGAGHHVESWNKGAGSPVSAADIEVDTFLKLKLGTLLPRAGWLSEETADAPARLARDLVWLVDPIDGTRDFLRGRTGWAVSVALVEAGRPVVGMLFAPAREETWIAIARGGAHCNGRPLCVSARETLAGARMPADSLMQEDCDLVMVAKPNSIALRIALVAEGAADLIATLRWGFEWDVAAAALIVSEAGGRITDALGHELTFDKRNPGAFGLVASTPTIHEAAIDRIAVRANRIAAAVR